MVYKVSVIIPSYNSKNFIETAISSIIKQSFGFNNIELIIVDDCSNDNSQILLNKYSEEYENIKVILLDENTGGPAKPRNIGLDNSTADYIMFLDQDDFFDEFFVEKVYSEIINSNVEIVESNIAMKIRDKWYSSQKVIEDKLEFNPLEYPDLFPKMIWNKIYSKKFLDDNNIRFPSDCLFEDLYFVASICSKSPMVVSLKNYYGYYNIFGNGDEYKSLSHNLSYDNIRRCFKGFELEFGVFDGADYDLASRFLSGDLTTFLANFIKTVGKNGDDKKDFESIFDNLRDLELKTNFNLNVYLLWAKFANKLVLKNHKKLFVYYCKLLLRILNSKVLYKFYTKNNFEVIDNLG